MGLTLGRKKMESTFITVPPSSVERVIEVRVREVRGQLVRLTFEADRDVAIVREELTQEKEGANG